MEFSLGPRARSYGHRLEGFERIGSTSAEALTRARGGECGPVWFVTAEQTSGRGRRARSWQSPRGNLAASFLEVLDIAPAVAATLGFVAGLALIAALEGSGKPSPLSDMPFPRYRLKWPNDMLANGSKLAGILLEAENVGAHTLAVVVGIGVNVTSAPHGLPYPATSLADVGVPHSAEALFAALSDAWVDHLRIWDHGRGLADILSRWLSRAEGVGGPVAVHMPGGTLRGTFDTIDSQGRLLVATSAGERIPVSAGDVYFGDAARAQEGT